MHALQYYLVNRLEITIFVNVIEIGIHIDMHIGIVNGPNLGRIGSREVDVYGLRTMDSLLNELRNTYTNLSISYMQSNHEGELIDELYRLSDGTACGIILNAGAYTHTSIAILDAIRAINPPVIEVHLSNILAREPYRHNSLIGGACLGTISGFGLDSYRLAVEALLHHHEQIQTNNHTK